MYAACEQLRIWFTIGLKMNPVLQRESRELLDAVNQSLARLEESGEMAAMQARWLHGQQK